MEIVLTKSAEFDTIVAEENEPNAADSGDYDGEAYRCHLYKVTKLTISQTSAMCHCVSDRFPTCAMCS